MSELSTYHTALPPQIIRAWGLEAAEAFEHWLDGKLLATQLKSLVEIPASIARQKINVLMLERVSNLLLANEPQLVELTPDRWVWRVPIDLTFPRYGRVGQVGQLDVDARYGMIHFDDKLLTEISEMAAQLAQKILEKSS